MQTPMMQIQSDIEDIVKVFGDNVPFIWVKLSLKVRDAIEEEKKMVINAWKNEREIVFFDLDKDELSEKTKQDLAETYYKETYAELLPAK